MFGGTGAGAGGSWLLSQPLALWPTGDLLCPCPLVPLLRGDGEVLATGLGRGGVGLGIPRAPAPGHQPACPAPQPLLGVKALFPSPLRGTKLILAKGYLQASLANGPVSGLEVSVSPPLSWALRE